MAITMTGDPGAVRQATVALLAGALRGRWLPLLATALIVSFAGLAWRLGGGLAGLGYALLFVAATVPGWPIGFALFGRRQAAGWVSGAAIGYGLTSIAFWAIMRAGWASGVAFAAGWAAVTILCWAVAGQVRAPLVPLGAWTRRDTCALLLILLLVPALVGPPFLHIGARDAGGNRLYRAYFTADFLWHAALTAELSTFRMPPANPYAADTAIHYYWGYFLFPATIAGVRPPGVASRVEQVLEINALCAGLIFVGMIFLATWAAVPHRRAVLLAVALAILAASAEGLYAIYDLIYRAHPLSELRELNIDGITYWFFQSLTIDGVPRALWYNPQHASACALGLVALMIAGAGVAAPSAAIALAGLVLGLAIAFSPFPGVAFTLAYGLAVAIDAARARARWRLARHATAAVGVILALAWCRWNGVLEEVDNAFFLGFFGQVRHAPLAVPIIGLGPVLLPALAGLWPLRGFPSRAVPHLAAVIVGFGLFYLVGIRQDPLYVGFRAGQVALIALPALAARFFVHCLEAPAGPLGLDFIAALFLLGLPTTVLDAYNAQDVTNNLMGPDAPWTLAVTPQEQAAFAWIQRSTPRTAVVQMEPTVRGRGAWTLIPSLAERRMAAGLPISLLMSDAYERRSAEARRIYSTRDAVEAWSSARALGIDYLYLDRTERRAHPAGALAKFERSPGYFSLAYRNDEVEIYTVARQAGGQPAGVR